MDRTAAIRLASEARVGRIATVRPDGTPHVVPFVFTLIQLDDGAITLYWKVDAKPKRSRDLQRIENLRANPAVEIVVDDYRDEDWTALWWVRLSGTGRTLSAGPEEDAALEALASKYLQYRSASSDTVVAIDVERITWWSAAEVNDR